MAGIKRKISGLFMKQRLVDRARIETKVKGIKVDRIEIKVHKKLVYT